MRSEARVVITNPTGLHARPAVKLAQLAAGFDANVEIRAGDDGEWVRARSTARVMKLKAGAQSTIHFRAEGSEADDALSALVDFVRRDFDEGPAATARGRTIEQLDGTAQEFPSASGAGRPEAPGGRSVSTTRAPTADESAGTVGEGTVRHRAHPCNVPNRSGTAEGRTSEAHAVSVTGDRPAAGPAPAVAQMARERAPAVVTGTTVGSTDPEAERAPAHVAVSIPGETSGGPADADAAQGGQTVPAVVASPGLALGVLHVLAASGDPARSAGDPSAERAALDEAVQRTIAGLRVLGDESGGLARDVVGFQISLLRDEELLVPVWVAIEAGTAADRAWGHHLAREIADYESAPTDYLRHRAADLRDLRERVAMAFAGDSHRPDTLPEQCVVIADELTPSRFLELDRSRAVAVATYSGSPASHVAMLARAHGVPMLPLHGGFVGLGMLDAACPGQVFTSPTPDQMLAAAQAVDRGAGTLFIVKNYSGDVMNFEMAEEMYEGASGTVSTNDDVAVEDSTYTTGRRGVAGTLVVEKVVGAAAESGADLEACRALGVRVNERTASMGVALTSCTVPEAGRSTFDIDDDQMEMGVGIHGEPGRRRLPLASADEIASQLVEPILNDLSPAAGDRALLLVNGFGATPLMELTLMYDAARRAMASSGVEVVRSLVGNCVMSLDMAGCSITLSLMDDEALSLWDAPVHAAALRWGC